MILLENEDIIWCEFDVCFGNLVVMDNIVDNFDVYCEEGFFGDWENKYFVVYVRYWYDVQDLDGLFEDYIEVDELDVIMCEFWLLMLYGKFDILFIFVIVVVWQSCDSELDLFWDAVKKMKWLFIIIMFLLFFSLCFLNVCWIVCQCQYDFCGIKLTVVISMKGVLEIKDFRYKNFVVCWFLVKFCYIM